MERGKKKKTKNKVKDLKKVAGSYLNQKGGTEASLSSQKSSFYLLSWHGINKYLIIYCIFLHIYQHNSKPKSH